jgi:ribosome-binding protein aMBF1 (putative translation factor)
MTKKRKPTTDAVEILHRKFYAGRSKRTAALDEARAGDDIGRQIYTLRTKAGLTQKSLGKLIGTTASVICRLEDGDESGPASVVSFRNARR